MIAKPARGALASIPDPTRSSELAVLALERPGVRRLGRVRLPIAGPYRPWATFYRFPDGRTVVVVRLWEVTGPVRRLYSLAELRAWAVQQRLDALCEEIEAITRAARR